MIKLLNTLYDYLQMRSWLFYIFVFAASYFYNVFNMIQVSERQFFTDFAENTTRLELYNDHTANIFLNNKFIICVRITIWLFVCIKMYIPIYSLFFNSGHMDRSTCKGPYAF